jgi:hypothetical protein
MPADSRDRSRPGRLELAYLWPYLAARRFVAALARYWRRVLVGGLVGWVLAVVLGALVLALLEVEGVLSRSTSDTFAIGIVLAGIALGALCAYAIRPQDRQAPARRPPASTPPLRG